MISYITGKILSKSKVSAVVLTTGGVGYEIGLTTLQLSGISEGQEIGFFAYLKVSDSSLDLYGFESAEEREFFTLLLSVSGVGPKSAMNILGLGSIDQIKDAIARQDVKYLTAVQGMGKKTAERMVVELKSKIAKQVTQVSEEKNGGVLGDVVEGLVSLGYSRDDAREVAQKLDSTGKTSEDLLRIALRMMSK